MKNVLSIQSHVVYGYAGNKAAVFPMQLLGVDVWALNTVQFSNHTQYGKWKGMVIPKEQIGEITKGIDEIDALHECDAILSGYIGAAEQGAEILKAVEKIKAKNSNAVYFCGYALFPSGILTKVALLPLVWRNFCVMKRWQKPI